MIDLIYSDLKTVVGTKCILKRVTFCPSRGYPHQAMAAILLILLLAGCAQTERREYYGEECRKAGERLGSSEYNDCVKSYQRGDSKGAIVF